MLWPVRCERGSPGPAGKASPPSCSGGRHGPRGILGQKAASLGHPWAKDGRAESPGHPGPPAPRLHVQNSPSSPKPRCRVLLPGPCQGPQAHTGRAAQGDWATPKLRWDTPHAPGWRPPQSLHPRGPRPISCREPGLAGQEAEDSRHVPALDQQGSQKSQPVPWRMEAFPSLGA